MYTKNAYACTHTFDSLNPKREYLVHKANISTGKYAQITCTLHKDTFAAHTQTQISNLFARFHKVFLHNLCLLMGKLDNLERNILPWIYYNYKFHDVGTHTFSKTFIIENTCQIMLRFM